jgi:hypothetical protein
VQSALLNRNVKTNVSLAAHLRWLMAPGRDRWKPMLMGLALCAAAAGTAVTVQPGPVSLLFVVLAFAAWFVGACGALGYVRWFLAGELEQARQDNTASVEKKSK